MGEAAEKIDDKTVEPVEGEEIKAEDLLDGEPKEIELSDDEVKASGNGWGDRESWAASGGDPDDWVSAKKFNERGEMIGSIRSLKQRLDSQERDFGDRIDSNKKLHVAQMKVTIADLEAKRDEKIGEADVDGANAIQGQIDDVKSTTAEPAAKTEEQLDAQVNQWNTDNQWIHEKTPKADYAKAQFARYGRAGDTIEQALAKIELDVAKAFPSTNPRRDKASAVEGGRSKPGSKGKVKLSWDQLTNEEAKWYGVMPNAWKSKDDYLKAVADERNA